MEGQGRASQSIVGTVELLSTVPTTHTLYPAFGLEKETGKRLGRSIRKGWMRQVSYKLSVISLF